ncbi:hypothetical protein AW27_010740 [Streptomyces sp. PCS3-D2]|uniref:hypothetical protein n=1 Tax=Streptomyces sp. PCS3-D2 TaxID=1460244 RepID=UPI0012FF489D|nr:hypothetical protein [Streptomyces sp. PCS3-D2]WKV71952.1 hypothetical protein AW27_010740 [Streptomyces sp. PCS3-D2]
MVLRKAAAMFASAGVMAGAVVVVAAPVASAGIRCTTEIVGSEAVAHCMANDDPSAVHSRYRVKATCLMGNNAGTFTRYGSWVYVGEGTTSRATCGSRILRVDFEVQK